MPGGRNGLPAAGPVPVPGAVPGACRGSPMPPWVVLTTGAVLSAASWSVLVRLRITCACCADNEARSSGDNSSSEASSLSDDGGDGGKGGKGGKGADGSTPVFTNTQVGSV